VLGPLPPAVVGQPRPAAFAASSIAILLLLLQPLLRLLRRDHPSPVPVAGRQVSLAAVTAMATLADVCPHHVTERGVAAKVRVAPEAKVTIKECARRVS
jgi:hypothetical protein